LGYWRESRSIASTTIHHNIVDIDKQLQRFWELEEMFPLANRLNSRRAQDGRYTVNQPMKQTKDQPLAIEPLRLCNQPQNQLALKIVIHQFPQL
jgi:hypothetical protein